MRDALTTLMELSLKIVWTNANDDYNKKLACIQLAKDMMFKRSEHTCKNALNFRTAIFFLAKYVSFLRSDSLFLALTLMELYGNWRFSCARLVIAPGFFLQQNISCGVEFTVTNVMAFLYSSYNYYCHSSGKMLNATFAIWSLEWVIFALASGTQMSLPNWW